MKSIILLIATCLTLAMAQESTQTVLSEMPERFRIEGTITMMTDSESENRFSPEAFKKLPVQLAFESSFHHVTIGSNVFRITTIMHVMPDNTIFFTLSGDEDNVFTIMPSVNFKDGHGVFYMLPKGGTEKATGMLIQLKED